MLGGGANRRSRPPVDGPRVTIIGSALWIHSWEHVPSDIVVAAALVASRVFRWRTAVRTMLGCRVPLDAAWLAKENELSQATAAARAFRALTCRARLTLWATR